MVKKLFLFILTACLAVTVAAMNTETSVFNEHVRSLQVFENGSPYTRAGIPVMMLNSPGGITVEFDIIEEEHEYLRYELIHCNAHWQPSSIAYMEYLDGFNEGTVEDYRYSGPTTFHYVHYTIPIPNDQMRPLLSGNYLMRVYNEERGPEHPLLQVRFMVAENKAFIRGTVSGRTDVDYNKAHQQLSLEVDLENADVRDLFNDIMVTIQQNGRTDNMVTLTKPLRVSGKRLIYEHLPELIFPGGNEYRRFETVSVNYPGMGVDHYEYISPYYHAVLEADAGRAGESYHYDQTLSGAFVVRESNADDPATEADYVVTHFYLDYPETPAFDFFIDADFVQHKFGPESRMVFNRASGMYELTTVLKQGAYSYQYLAVKNGTDVGRTDLTEGNHYETQNHYNIYVYHRRPGERYDRLIGVGML